VQWPVKDMFAESEAYVGMPARGTKVYNWKKHQLLSGSKGLDAEIWKEIKANEGSTMWSDRKARLFDCIRSKNVNKIAYIIYVYDHQYIQNQRCRALIVS
jgi:hypothetical protein